MDSWTRRGVADLRGAGTVDRGARRAWACWRSEAFGRGGRARACNGAAGGVWLGSKNFVGSVFRTKFTRELYCAVA